jgi:hypothetical protein
VVLTSFFFLAVVTSGLLNMSKDTYIVVGCGAPAITGGKETHQGGEKHKKNMERLSKHFINH